MSKYWNFEKIEDIKPGEYVVKSSLLEPVYGEEFCKKLEKQCKNSLYGEIKDVTK